MFSFLKTQKAQKIIALALLAILLVAIPLTVWYGQQQQQTQQRASTNVWNGGTDSCGKVHVAFESENPSCPNGSGTVTDTYTTTVILTSQDGATHQVSYLFESFWCKDSTELGDGVNPTSCIKRVKSDSQTISVGPGSGVTVTSPLQTASSYGFGGSCGVYQTDFSFTTDDTSCRFGYSALDPSPSHPVLAAGYCNTNQICSVPSNTPTPTSSPTPTPTTPITPTDTPTPTPTIPVTTTPTTTPTPTTVTNTPTPGPSATPTPTTVVTATPKPTLPPTGPGNTIMGIGVLGAAAAVIGTVVLLAL